MFFVQNVSLDAREKEKMRKDEKKKRKKYVCMKR